MSDAAIPSGHRDALPLSYAEAAEARPPSPSRRYLLLALLYFSEGAPIGYIWWAMPAKLRAAGMPIEHVGGLVALLTVPWTFKFLWAPAVDALQGPRWGLRSWITLSQVLMGLALLPLTILPLSATLQVAAVLLVIHAVAAATQDVAIDAFAIRILAPDERGRATGWMQAGMLLARSIFGGMALYLEQFAGERVMLAALIVCIWSTLIILWLSDIRPAPTVERQSGAAGAFVLALKRALLRRSTWLGIAVAATAGAGFEAVGGLLGPFLIDNGVSAARVGLFLALPVVVCMIAGALGGGWLTDRLGAKRLVVVSIAGIAAWITVIAAGRMAFDLTGAGLAAVVLPLYLLIGTLTASSYALLMNLTDPTIGGTQFSTFMGATNACEVWSVALAGVIAASLGYAAAFLIAGGVSLVAIPLTLLIPAKPPETPPATPGAAFEVVRRDG